MRFAIVTLTDRTYWTGKYWSQHSKDAKVYKTMRVRDVCAKLEKQVQCPLVCINLTNRQYFY